MKYLVEYKFGGKDREHVFAKDRKQALEVFHAEKFPNLSKRRSAVAPPLICSVRLISR